MVSRPCFKAAILGAVVFNVSNIAIAQEWKWINDELYAQLRNIHRLIEGDIQRDKQVRRAALESSEEMWQYINANSNEPDIDQAWFRLFYMDMRAGNQKVFSEHLQICLKKFSKDSNIFRSARRLLARQALFKARGLTELQAEIQRFEKDFPRALIDNMDLRMVAAEHALAAGDTSTAGKLYGEADTLLKTASEEWSGNDQLRSSLQAARKTNQDRLELFRKSFDDFGGDDLNGNPIQFRDFHGSVALVSFWCSCLDCKSGHLADCRTLYKAFRAKGLTILGISLEPTADDAKRAVKELKLNWRHLWNDKDSANPYMTAFKVKEAPYSVLFDASGRIRYIGLSGLELKEKVEKLLAELSRPEGK